MLHVAAPPTLYRPCGHICTASLVAPGSGHANPALQLLHEVAPAPLYLPAGQMADGGVGDVDPDGHA
jgi:hypothetical protein